MLTLATLTLHPGPDTVAHAQTWLEQAATRHQWPTRTAFALQLSMDEALTNTVTYGFADSACANPTITLTLYADHTFIMLDIIDNGAAFDPTRKQPADLASSLDQATPGGHGIRLMRHYLHDIEYTYANGQNRLRLIAQLKPQEP